MKEIYLAIQEQLTTYLPQVVHFDLWNNQLTEFDNELPFVRPAAFVEFLPIQWQQMQGGKKKGDVRIRVHIVQDSYSSSSRDSRDQTNALELLDFAMQADDVLEHFIPPNCTSFQGTNTDPDVNHGNVIDIINEYNFIWTKSINKPGRNEIEVTPELKVTGEFIE